MVIFTRQAAQIPLFNLLVYKEAFTATSIFIPVVYRFHDEIPYYIYCRCYSVHSKHQIYLRQFPFRFFICVELTRFERPHAKFSYLWGVHNELEFLFHKFLPVVKFCKPFGAYDIKIGMKLEGDIRVGS